jgi:hypothetical protein
MEVIPCKHWVRALALAPQILRNLREKLSGASAILRLNGFSQRDKFGGPENAISGNFAKSTSEVQPGENQNRR